MWGVWSDLAEVWLSTSGGVFVTDCRAVAEAQVRAEEYQREMQIMRAEAKAEMARQQQSGIITPGAMQIPGMGIVPLGGNRRSATQAPPGNISIQIPPDARWRARRFDEWWKEIRVKDGKAVDLTG